MTKLTTERLEQFIANPLGNPLYRTEQMDMARQLLSHKQAAKNPFAWSHTKLSKGCGMTTQLYVAPVLPKQPELVENLKKVMNNWLAMEPKLAFQPEFTDVMMLLDAEPVPAQPVIPEQANILGYFSFDPEDGAEILKDRQTAIDNCNASIDLYRESMQEEYPDGWSDDVKRVCWGVILQEARGFDAQGIPENDPNHTYQTLDYRLYPDSTNTVTAQPISNPYKFLGERAKYRVIIEGFSNSRSVDFEACSQEEAEEIGRDIFHEECNYGVERLESIPAQESE